MDRELDDAIRDYAEAVRNKFMREIQAGQNMDELVDKLEGTIKEERLNIWNDSKLKMDPERNSFIICLISNMNKARRNVAIAHELGHLFLHTNFIASKTDAEQLYIPDFYKNRDYKKEKEADDFARNLLMPKNEYIDKVKRYTNPQTDDVNIQSVAEYFGVSVDDALYRGVKLGVLHWFL